MAEKVGQFVRRRVDFTAKSREKRRGCQRFSYYINIYRYGWGSGKGFYVRINLFCRVHSWSTFDFPVSLSLLE
jgi:hypothetical protein